jgi:hypothetical protein
LFQKKAKNYWRNLGPAGEAIGKMASDLWQRLNCMLLQICLLSIIYTTAGKLILNGVCGS